METETALETSCNFKKLGMGKVPKKKIVSVKCSHAVFSFLSTLGDEDIQFGAVWFGALCVNFRQPYISKHRI
jgi:hypothetical protein